MNRTQVVLTVAILILSAVFIFGKKHKFETEERERQAARYFPHLETEDVGSIVLWSKEPSYQYTVTRNAGRIWLDGHLVALESSDQLVYSLAELKQVKLISEKPTEADFKEYGFDEPSYKITISNNDGKNLGTVLLGDRTPDVNHFYARMESGGPIHTLEAYMLTLIDEKPEDLREKSAFPIEVAASDLFLMNISDGVNAEFVKTREKEDESRGTFRLKAQDKEVDETRVDAFMNELKDLKVVRFLAHDENTDIGKVQARYESQAEWTEFSVVTELCQAVAVNPKLRYGRRFLVKKGDKEPLPETVERFVIELAADSHILSPSLDRFEDLRVVRLMVDDVRKVKATHEGKTLDAELLTPGLWKYITPELEADNTNSRMITDLLYAVRDLRYLEVTKKAVDSGQPTWEISLELEGQSFKLGFGKLETGNPYVETKGQRYLLKDESTSALTEALQKILSK